MKLLKTMVAAVALMGIGISTANAIELRNCDYENHQVKITSPTMDKEYEFRARTLSLIICMGECELDVVGVGKVKAHQDDIVTIRDGKVTAEPAPKSASSEN